MVFYALALTYALLFFKHVCVFGINVTIDDQNGDSVTGAVPSYSPGNKWQQGSQCPGCFAQPDPQQTFDGSE
jgi:hypothetical protein